ncbi:peptidylprolyl isomerase [Jeongeupia naejangsanensis]|uniref:Periplasmic chaperone PpiD n=1 Tax=Jeongeupia naejangsanensis TaxID=613195 RepID=A0ABS2BKF8_9NEIS|nr:peptidylprolyl isomerase [Jeongeupia naejangsanensis]MBM3115309.1 peptidylprolyl isomerase [Jeongeupia naejangsanensis]
MFDLVQKNKTAVQVVLGLVALGLVVGFGVSGYSAMEGGDDFYAKVGGSRITERDVAQATNGQTVSNEMKPMVVEQLVRQKLLLQAAAKQNFVATESELQKAIAAIPAFQENGHFDPKKYETLLASQQMTAAQFEERVRDDIALRHLLSAFVAGNFQSQRTMDRMAKLLGEKRSVSVAVLKPEAYFAQANVSDAEIKQYYDQHQQELKTPEMVKVAYVVLSQADLAKTQNVSDADVQQYFDAHKADLGEEERRAAHILIATPKGASAEQLAAAKAKAESVLKEVTANPARFAELAKQYSQDPGSAEQGGDLGWFGHGAMVKPFDDAVFKLNKGQLSGLVQSEFGFHIIKLEDVRGRTLADLKPEIEQKLKLERAQAAFQGQLEKFNELVYQQGSSLQPAADQFKLQVQQSGWITRQGSQDQLLNNPKLAEAVFSDDVLKGKHNTEAIEVAPGTVVSARIVEHKPAAVPSLAIVSADLAAKLKTEKALKLAQEDGARKLAALQKGETVVAEWQPGGELNRGEARGIDPQTLSAVFRAPADKLPSYVGNAVPQQGYVLYRVEKSTPAPQLDAQLLQRMREGLGQMYGQVEIASYIDSLRKSAKIEYGRALQAKPAE